MLEKQPNEVEVTQFLMPNGKRKKVYADVGKDYAEKANKRNMILSIEVTFGGLVTVYGRLPDMDEEDELCEISMEGRQSTGPINLLKKIIDELDNKENKCQTN